MRQFCQPRLNECQTQDSMVPVAKKKNDGVSNDQRKFKWEGRGRREERGIGHMSDA